MSINKEMVIEDEDEASTVLKGLNILVVDDDPVFCSMIRVILEHYACHVTEANNGLEGLKKLNTLTPDVLLCDLSMPILNGIEFVEEVVVEYPMLPIIVISGTGNMKDVANVLRLGTKDFLIKPINDASLLVKSIQSVLNQSYQEHSEDFSNQWFKASNIEGSEAKELHWHLDYLKKTPNIGRELLLALLPENDAQYRNWRLQYCLLQSASNMPLVFDYQWLLDGRLFFYLIDSDIEGEEGVVSCLLIRALFNDFIRNTKSKLHSLSDLVGSIEKGITVVNGADSISAMFGYVDLSEEQISILPTGLNAIWEIDGVERYVIDNEKPLSHNATNNRIHKFPLKKHNNLLLSCLARSSFKLTLTQSE